MHTAAIDLDLLEARLKLYAGDADGLRDSRGRRITFEELRAVFALARQADKLGDALRRFHYHEDAEERPWLFLQGNDGSSTLLNLNIPTQEVGIIADCVNAARDAVREYDAVRCGMPIERDTFTLE